MRKLLTHLAQFSSFSKQGELLCTQSLVYLLAAPDARAAFADCISARARIPVATELEWRAEVRQEDRGRPDLEGCAADKRPIVKIEAKLGAELHEGQLRSYVNDLQARSGGGLLLVLVPRRRAGEAAHAVQRAFAVETEGPWRVPESPGCLVALMFWEDLVEALRAVRSESFRADFEQFEAMYRVLKGHDIEPVDSESQLLDPEREEALVSLVDRVTRRLSQEGKVLPMGQERDPVGYRRRYVCLPLGDEHPCFSLGVRLPFAGHSTPIWMRFNQTTSKFPIIRERLVASSLSMRLVESGGHVWIPIDVPLRTGGEGMVESLAGQVQDLIHVAYRPSPDSHNLEP